MNRRLVVVEYYATSTRLYAFGVRSDFEAPAVAEIAVDIRRLQRDVDAVSGHLSQVARDVVQWPELSACVAPVLRWSEPEDLICFIPFGPLFHVPLHAVTAEGEPLIVRNPVFYAPSASALRFCVGRRRAGAQIRTPAVFGNPEGDLISAAREAEEVAELLQVEPTLWRQATREAFCAAIETSDLIHFAGHAKFFPHDPLGSGLKFTNGTILSARELFEFNAPALRLVTLSGCVTGYNEVRPGDELLGLTRAFLYAGASSLLATLWAIQDVAAAKLMKDFYRRWLREGYSKIHALRAAQTELLRSGGDPSAWAPFVLIGDWL